MPNIEKIIDFQKKKKIFHQKFPVVTSNAILAFGKSDEKFFRQKSKQFLLGFRNQIDEYIFYPKKWSCSKKKQSEYPEYHFDEGSESFFIRSPTAMYSNLGISFEKDAQKTQAFFWTLWMQFWQSWQKFSVKKTKRFLTNFRNYWNNHFFSQKYLNFTVKIFWARILPFWHVWKEFLPKNPKKSLVRFSQTNNGIIFLSHKVFTSSKELIAHAKSSSEKRAEFFAKIRTFVHLEFKIIF